MNFEDAYGGNIYPSPFSATMDFRTGGQSVIDHYFNPNNVPAVPNRPIPLGINITPSTNYGPEWMGTSYGPQRVGAYQPSGTTGMQRLAPPALPAPTGPGSMGMSAMAGPGHYAGFGSYGALGGSGGLLPQLIPVLGPIGNTLLYVGLGLLIASLLLPKFGKKVKAQIKKGAKAVGAGKFANKLF